MKRSDLFLVRLWAEEAGDGETEWRGKVQRAVNGEAHDFQDWPQLVDLLRQMMVRDQESRAGVSRRTVIPDP